MLFAGVKDIEGSMSDGRKVSWRGRPQRSQRPQQPVGWPHPPGNARLPPMQIDYPIIADPDRAIAKQWGACAAPSRPTTGRGA